MIQHKPIHVAIPSLQQRLLHMQKYDYTIHYKPGKDMVLADCLSHFPSNTNYLPIPLAQNIQHIQLSSADLDIIKGSVECDPVYSTIYHLTLWGWPDLVQDAPILSDTSGALGMNFPLTLAFSRGQGPVFHQNYSKGPLLICMELIRSWQDAGLGEGMHVLAWHRCWYHWLYQLVYHLHKTQGLSTCPAYATLRHTWWPLAGHHSGLHDPQWSWVSYNLWCL